MCHKLCTILMILILLITKKAIDYANISRGELNKLKDLQLREICESLNGKYRKNSEIIMN